MVRAHEDEFNDIVDLRHYLTWRIDKFLTANSDLFGISKIVQGKPLGHHSHRRQWTELTVCVIGPAAPDGGAMLATYLVSCVTAADGAVV